MSNNPRSRRKRRFWREVNLGKRVAPMNWFPPLRSVSHGRDHVELPGAASSSTPMPQVAGAPMDIVSVDDIASYRCASPRCPGYPYKASELAHPANTCGHRPRSEGA